MVKKYKNNSEYSYALGTTLVFELLKNKVEYVTKIYIHPNLTKDETYNKLLNLCDMHHIPYEESIKAFNILSSKENCFVIGEFKKFTSHLDSSNHVVLVNPQDAGNIGTIMRSSLGFGFCNIAIIKPAVDIFNPKVIRSSMGSIFSLNVEYFESFSEYENKFKSHAFYPFLLQTNNSLSSITPPDKNYSLIFGNEASGLPREFLNVGTPLIIKHSNLIDSLNLPIAVSIALYEFTKESFKK